jgi:hypothetical protein
MTVIGSSGVWRHGTEIDRDGKAGGHGGTPPAGVFGQK